MNKLLMVHIPRTGGTSFNHFFTNVRELTFTSFGHQKLNTHEMEKRKDWFKFAMVRNPWSWVASHYLTIKYSIENRIRNDINETTNTVKKSFKDYIHHFIENANNQSWYITDEEKITVDYIGQFENLEKEFNYICDKMGILNPQMPIKHSEGGGRQPFNDEYKKIYDQETIDLVSDHFKEDIKRFNYQY